MIHRSEIRWGGLLLVVGLAVWLPRLSGPLDLRYDAGVYYLLGTALAEGKGYRLLNEPGAIEGNQYPPLLPALVAVHQWALGTSDPASVAVWLRRSYFLLFQLALLGVYMLACRSVRPPWACGIALLSLLSLKTFFLSDLLFAEVPFLLATVGFLLCHQRGRGTGAFMGMALCGVAALLLRTAGVALLAAWVAESVFRREWKQLVVRLLVAVVPFLGWQAHVRRVEASTEYREPAYPYQRAQYQFYNVSYAENILKLKDPFVPELGPATAPDLILRFLHNLPRLLTSLGEILTGGTGFWEGLANPPPGSADRLVIVVWANLLSGTVGILILAGLMRWALRREWLLTLYLVASLVMVCATPWPEQFTRYLIPLQPFLLLGLVELLESLRAPGRAGWPGFGRRVLRSFGTVTLASGLLLTGVDVFRAFQNRRAEGAVYEGPDLPQPARLFYYGREWREFDLAVYWLKEHARPDAVVATVAPHWVYLKTGLKTVMPPYEKDRARAQQLMSAVPVTYVLIDDLGFLDIMRRYAQPAVKAHPEQWKLVYTVPRAQSKYRGRTYIYQWVE